MKQEYLSIRNLIAGEEGTSLDRFHLRMSQGEFVELMGIEGSGKAQLTGVLTGSVRIQTGTVCIGSRTYGPGEILNSPDILHIGSTPSLAGSLTVAENVALLTRSRKPRILVHRREIIDRVNFLLSEFGLSIRAETRADELGEGEKRAVELLRAVENDIPFILISDIFQTTGQADLQMIESLLRKIKARRYTILVLGSGFPRFIDLDDRIEVIRRGRHVRTFYHNNYDREAYVRWSLGMQDPALARAEATGHAGISTFHGAALPASGKRNSSGAQRLTIRDLDLPGIQNIHLDAKAGEIIGLYDMNNRGNHELLQCLTGEARPLGGEMFLDGVPYAPDSPDDISRRGVDFLPHNILSFAVVEGMSYSENLELSTMRRHSLFGTFVKKRVQDFLADEYGRELEAEDPGHAKGRDLNTNDRMRVALQRILLHHPKLLLIEDLLSDMNIELLRIETEYFSRLTETGCTILISSPNLTVLRQVTDRIIVLGTNT